jgi:hypothetical protein
MLKFGEQVEVEVVVVFLHRLVSIGVLEEVGVAVTHLGC